MSTSIARNPSGLVALGPFWRSALRRWFLDRQLEGWDKIIEDLADDPMAVRILESQKAWCERVAFFQLMNAGDFERAYRHHFPGRLTF